MAKKTTKFFNRLFNEVSKTGDDFSKSALKTFANDARKAGRSGENISNLANEFIEGVTAPKNIIENATETVASGTKTARAATKKASTTSKGAKTGQIEFDIDTPTHVNAQEQGNFFDAIDTAPKNTPKNTPVVSSNEGVQQSIFGAPEGQTSLFDADTTDYIKQIRNSDAEISTKRNTNPVNKERLKELRRKQANGEFKLKDGTEFTGNDMQRSGQSNFNGTKTKSNTAKQNKTYQDKQYNKEKGRLEYESQNGATWKDRRNANKELKNLNRDDFNGPNNKSTDKNKDKFANQNFAYKMAAMGVGGGLVLSMANSGGQQSNSQLYGQQY